MDSTEMMIYSEILAYGYATSDEIENRRWADEQAEAEAETVGA